MVHKKRLLLGNREALSVRAEASSSPRIQFLIEEQGRLLDLPAAELVFSSGKRLSFCINSDYDSIHELNYQFMHYHTSFVDYLSSRQLVLFCKYSLFSISLDTFE